ncbi:DUF2637 domain-containing protein [Streptomyces sp. NPDC000609]|uniref:DUF2637 domain-containing protein n=1 Tax=Streptomyces sp. NPDC000609 TaxID=3160957 RepID=UPI0033943A78
MVEELPGARTAPPPQQMESAVAEAAPEGIEESSAPRHRGLMIPLAILAVLAGLAAAVVGFALSYGALRAAAVGWDFGDWQSYAFPVGVDGLIIALYTIDLVLAWRRMSRPWIKGAAHAVTAVTIVLNMSAAAGSAPGSPGLTDALADHPARLLAHAAMPIAYVLLTEAARWAIVRTAQLEAGHDDDHLTLADWALRFPTTWAVYKHAKTWPSSYCEARAHVRELAIYRVWLRHREEIEAGLAEGQVGVLDRLPDLLAPYGVSVDRARAIPDEMREREREIEEARQRREDKRRREEQRQAREDTREQERQRREDEHAERLAAIAAEAEELRQAGELDVLRARTAGTTRAAEAEAEATADTASIQAAAARQAAERAATEVARLAAAEEEAEETARTAALRRQAAEDDHRADVIARDRAALAAEEARLAKSARDAAAETAARLRQETEDAEAAEAARYRVAELRAATARINRRAAEDEDMARLLPRERSILRVARMMLQRCGGGREVSSLLAAVSISDVEVELSVGRSAAADYRKEAVARIDAGYTLPDPGDSI